MIFRNIPNSAHSLKQTLSTLQKHHQIKIIFLEADRATLIRRYSDSRRLHPLSLKDLSLEAAIDEEYCYLEPLIQHANLILDTTHLSTHSLAERLHEFFTR